MNLLVSVEGLTPRETMEELVDKTEPLLCSDIRVEIANQLLLHNQGLELLSLRLTIMSTSVADIIEGINKTSCPAEGEELATLVSQQACILAPYIKNKRKALYAAERLPRVRSAQEPSLLGQVVNCPPHSLAAYWVIQAAAASEQGSQKRARSKWDRKGIFFLTLAGKLSNRTPS